MQEDIGKFAAIRKNISTTTCLSPTRLVLNSMNKKERKNIVASPSTKQK